MSLAMTQVTQLLSQAQAGDPQAAERLLPLVYDELRRLAEARLAQERPGQTLQPTALVHEAYLRLVDVEYRQTWNGRGHFFAAAGEAMRRILVDLARRKRSRKHGGGLQRQDLSAAEQVESQRDDRLLAIDAALGKLEAEAPVKAALVKLRYFAGFSHQEAAEALGISRATADRYWQYAKVFLFSELADSAEIEEIPESE